MSECEHKWVHKQTDYFKQHEEYGIINYTKVDYYFCENCLEELEKKKHERIFRRSKSIKELSLSYRKKRIESDVDRKFQKIVRKHPFIEMILKSSKSAKVDEITALKMCVNFLEDTNKDLFNL